MNIEAVKVADSATQRQMSRDLDTVSGAKNKADDMASNEKVEKRLIQPEEMLQQIKALTEEGLYSVRFENDSNVGELIVKVVDQETNEVIRQIPAEELLHLTERLEDLRGNIVDTEG